MDVITKDEVVMVLRSEADLYEERSKTDKRMNLVVEILYLLYGKILGG